MRVQIAHPGIDDDRDRRIVEEVLSAENFDRDPAFRRERLPGPRIAYEMQPVVLLAAVGLTGSRAIVREKSVRAIAGDPPSATSTSSRSSPRRLFTG